MFNPDEPRDEKGEWTSGGLSSEEKRAIGVYQNAASMKENKALRKTGVMTENQKTLQAVIKNAKLKEDVTVYRGVGGSMTVANSFAKLKPGDEIHDKGFVSTSANKETAARFSDVPLFLKINLKAGDSALSMKQFGGTYSFENEHVLPAGSRFRMVGSKIESVAKFTGVPAQQMRIVELELIR